MHVTSAAFVLLGSVALAWAGARQQSVCYDGLNCYQDDPPFDSLPLPWSPDKIDATFALYSRANRNSPEYITPANPGRFSPFKDTKVLIHGFNTNSGESQWMGEMKDKFLNMGDFNVVLVDWGKGAQTGLTNYDQAASNTRVVGDLVSQLLVAIDAPLGRVHCVGHSLGAHTCGYAGAGRKLGRITGLDPAGPNFKGKPAQARLDPSDASFVDNIHTHGQDGLLVNFGIGEPIGHVDFFPNGGGTQPGCWNRKRRDVTRLTSQEVDLLKATEARDYVVKVVNGRSRTLQVQPRGEGISCSHGRAYEFFSESLSSSCPFTAYPCANLNDAKQGKCSGCGAGCQRMGYYSDRSSARGIFYLTTTSSKPYCKA